MPVTLRLALSGALLVLLVGCSSATPSPSPTSAAADHTSAPGSQVSQATQPAKAGLATPEDAVRAYLEGVRQADVDAILATSAVEDAAAHFDFVAQADRLKVLQMVGPGPAQYPFYADINRAWFSARLLSQSQTLSYGLLSSSPVVANPVPADGPAASAFAQDVDPAGLSGLQVLDVRPPKASLENDPAYRANALAQAAIYGASDDVQRLALVSLDGSDYEVGFELLKYAGGWKVLIQNSTIAGGPATGAAQPITQEEFEQQTGS